MDFEHFEGPHKSRPDKRNLENKLVDAVFSCVDYDAEGHAWLDNIKAVAKVKRVLANERRSEQRDTDRRNTN